VEISFSEGKTAPGVSHDGPTGGTRRKLGNDLTIVTGLFLRIINTVEDHNLARPWNVFLAQLQTASDA
jgi:hypothetical protein